MFITSGGDQLMFSMKVDQRAQQLAAQASASSHSDAMMMFGGCGFTMGAQQHPQFAQQAAWPAAAATSSSSRSCKAPKVVCCQVPGCMADLTAEPKVYCLKKRICSRHMAADVLPIGTQPMRFCFQCAKVEALVEFDGSKRSCRASLQRRKTRPSASSQQPAAPTPTASGSSGLMPPPCALGADAWYAPPATATVGPLGSLGAPLSASDSDGFVGDVWAQLQPCAPAGFVACGAPDAMMLPPAPAPVAAPAPAGAHWQQQSDTTSSPKTVSQGGAELFFASASSASPAGSPTMARAAAAAELPCMLAMPVGADGSSTRLPSSSAAAPPLLPGALCSPAALRAHSMPDPASLERTAAQLRTMEDELQALHSHLRSLQQALLLQERGAATSRGV